MSSSTVTRVVQTARSQVQSATSLSPTEKKFFDDHIRQFATMVESLLINNRDKIEHQIQTNLIPFVRQVIRQWMENNRVTIDELTQTIADRISQRIIAENPRLAPTMSQRSNNRFASTGGSQSAAQYSGITSQYINYDNLTPQTCATIHDPPCQYSSKSVNYDVRAKSGVGTGHGF